jgi:hypothetical protein
MMPPALQPSEAASGLTLCESKLDIRLSYKISREVNSSAENATRLKKSPQTFVLPSHYLDKNISVPSP